ncbi:MAG: ATP-binding cassette domain-containing protein [Bryobacterales bacterium]|nr:ATP-binding cassette domain-containing protein [Bryobacterales bacterium]
MTFDLEIPTQEGQPLTLNLKDGEVLVVLGANGTGKSSLMCRFAQMHAKRSRKISAHRQTWMDTDALNMTPAAKLQTEKAIQNTDQQIESRYRDDYAAQRTSMTIYDLIDAENVRARRITALIDAGDVKAAKQASKQKAPITTINELLRQSNLPITISIQANERVMASKLDGPEYSAAQLSDGERNALLIAGNVLTAESGMLLIIDEPERHLHRSIISPLLGQLFQIRSDCAFVVSTHDHGLPLELPAAQTLLLRTCTFDGQSAQNWKADVMPPDASLDETIKRDLLGARRRILFVEGTERSLDKALYSLIFPMVSVIPKGSCHDVERAVEGARAVERFHRAKAYGIIDGDGYEPDQIQDKRIKRVYALPYYSVEAIYFHPDIIQRIAARKAYINGANASNMAKEALEAGISAIAGHTERLSKKSAKKLVRKLIIEQLPNDDKLLKGKNIKIQNNASSILDQRKQELDAGISNGDWETILTKCPVRESNALTKISMKLGFPSRQEYQQSVRQLLATDESALIATRGLFQNLYEQLNA